VQSIWGYKNTIPLWHTSRKTHSEMIISGTNFHRFIEHLKFPIRPTHVVCGASAPAYAITPELMPFRAAPPLPRSSRGCRPRTLVKRQLPSVTSSHDASLHSAPGATVSLGGTLWWNRKRLQAGSEVESSSVMPIVCRYAATMCEARPGRSVKHVRQSCLADSKESQDSKSKEDPPNILWW
jgi:hypothetical protein